MPRPKPAPVSAGRFREADVAASSGGKKGGSSLPLPPPPPPGAVGGAGIRPYTPAELKALKTREKQALDAKLTGPFTPEAILSGYASQVASLYGPAHPAAEAMAKHGMSNKMSATAFSTWLRSRPEFADTEIGRKMRTDALTVIAQTFGYVT